MRRLRGAIGLASSWLVLGLLAAPATAAPPATWITLGTMGGPIANAHRSQPANVLLTDDGAILIDTGDGAAEQLAKAGVALPRVTAVLLSHLHWDHTGGLAAILGLRYQTNVPGKLRIVGPPGTKALVAGLVASMQPGAEAGYGAPDAPRIDPASAVEVSEIGGGDTVILGSTRITAVQNSHYSFAAGSEQDRRFKSLSFRFDTPGRSIVYTGDTGPSPAVERLAQGADLLVSEMIDVPATVANVRRNTPAMSAAALSDLTWHLSHHHLTPAQVGELAGRAKVKRLVVTHMVPGNLTPGAVAAYLKAVAANFAGPSEIADDLDRF